MEFFCFDADTLQDAARFADALSRMPAARQKQVHAYRFAKDQRLCLAAGVLLDDWLRTQGTTLCAIPIATHAQGKPYFPSQPHWHFNLSHAGRYAVLATDERPIGVDIEQLHAFSLEIATRYFAPEEQAQLQACPTATAQQQLFFQLWTCKEAYLKATGAGLHEDLLSFAVDVAQGRLRYPHTQPCYRFYHPAVPAGYVASVCVQEV